MLVEMVRPQISRFAGIPLRMGEETSIDALSGTIMVTVETSIFGGISRTIKLTPTDSLTSPKRVEDDLLGQIEAGIKELVAEAELHAIVDYRWPAS